MKPSSRSSEKKRSKIRRDNRIMIAVGVVAALAIVAVIVLILVRLDDEAKTAADETTVFPVPTVSSDATTEEPTTSSDASTEETTEPTETADFEIDGFVQTDLLPETVLKENLKLACVGSYSGAYWEDGSDEAVENIWAVVVQNTGDTIIAEAIICLQCGEETVSFKLTGLAGSCYCLVLAQDRAAFDADASVTAPSCLSLAECGETTVTDFGSDFALAPADGILTLQNISSKTFRSEVYLCYKNYDSNGVFLGGITYRVNFGTDFAPDEVRQKAELHFTNDSAVLYMLYENE